MRKVLKYIFPKYKNYTQIVLRNKLRRLSKPPVENKYLFILSPPYCGSTLLNEIISTSPNVSTNNPYGTREGQTLPTIRKIMFDDNKRWEHAVDYDWEYIKKEWRKYWDITKPVLLEKSPPNIIRAASINQTFPNSYFIIFYRNPYAHCESLIRRNKITATEAAEFVLRCLEYQRNNKLMPLNSLSISYEELTMMPEKFEYKINEFIPEINSINTNADFAAHNFRNKKMRIENLNQEKIKNLSPTQLNDITAVFTKDKELLAFFNYEIISEHSANI